MKKIFTLCCLAAATCANAQTLTKFNTESIENGYQIMDISNNGKYIGGVTAQNEMFMIEVETKKTVIKEMLDEWGAEVRGVSNNGIGVGYNGPAATLSINGDFKIIEEATEEYNTLAEDITDDDKIIVGSINSNTYMEGWQKKPCVWIDGVRTMLPEPTTEQIGFNYNGASAKRVSADGSVIMGHLIADIGEPAALWIKDGDTYKLDSIWKGKFRPTQWDDELGDFREYDEPYLTFQWANVSANGKYALVIISEYLGEEEIEIYEGYTYTTVLQTENRIGIYNIETKELKIITVDGSRGIDAETDLTPTDISDDGTVIGYTGDGSFGSPRLGFILKAGEEQPRLLKDVYSQFEEFTTYDDNGINSPLGITADGRYITGFGYNVAEMEIDGEVWPMSYIEGYVLDTQAVSDGISNLTVNTKKNTEYFTVDGRKVAAPVKGLNIIKTAKGETRKIFVK